MPLTDQILTKTPYKTIYNKLNIYHFIKFIILLKEMQNIRRLKIYYKPFCNIFQSKHDVVPYTYHYQMTQAIELRLKRQAWIMHTKSTVIDFQ